VQGLFRSARRCTDGARKLTPLEPLVGFAQRVPNPTHGSGWIRSVTTYVAITSVKKSHQRQLVDFSIAACFSSSNERSTNWRWWDS
jgi:hypothetical protein